MKKSRLMPAYAIIALMAGGASVVNCHAGLDYWDPQGATGGLSGYTGSENGTWETSSWRTNAYSGNISLPWTESNAVCFAYGGGASTPAFTVTMNANHTVAGFFNGPLGPDPCLATISGTGIITLPANTFQGCHVNNDAGDPGQIVFNVPIAGTGGFGDGIALEGSGPVYFNAINTFSFGTYLGYSGDDWTGTLYITNANSSQPGICTSFGTGGIYVSNDVGGAVVAQGTAPFTITNAFYNINPAAFVASVTLNIVGNPAGLTFSGPWSLSGSAGATPAVSLMGIGSGGAANDLVGISGIISGTNGFFKFGVGILALSGVNTYSGNTAVNAGTLALTNGGSINNTPNLTILTNGTFDVTGADPYTLSSSTSLNAKGAGTVQGGTAAAINDSAAGGSISLGSQQINLTFTPTATSGDSSHPSLVVLQGALTLNNNQLVVTNAAASKLGAGTYTLIEVNGGTINGAPSPDVIVEGNGLAAGAVATVAVSGSSVVMTVATAANATTTTISAIPAITYGQASSFTATIAPVPDGGDVQFFLNGAPFGAPVAVNTLTGTATSAGTSTALAFGTYAITATYSGSSDNAFGASSAAAVSLVVNKASLTVTASAQSLVYGTALTTNGSTSFTSSALQNGETIGSVTITGGGTGYAATNTPVGNAYTLTPSAAAGGSGTEANYSITYVAGTLAITPKAATITASAGSYTYGTAYTGLGTLKTTFTQSGFVNGNAASNGTVTLTCTTNANAGAANAPVAESPYGITPSALAVVAGKTSGTYTNFNPANYTITYVNGNLTESQLAVKLTGSQPYNGSDWIEASQLTVSNKVGSDTVYVAQGLAFSEFTLSNPPVTIPGVWPIASYGTLVLGNAGGQGTGVGATAATDQFNAPASLAVDTSGNLYVADTANNRVCEVTPAGVQTVVPFTGLSNPVGVAVDTSSNIYVTDPSLNAVYEMPAGGSQTTVAFSGLSYPTGIAVDQSGDVFLSDTLNNRVLELPAGGSQTTVPGLSVLLPAGVAVDTNGDIFVVSAGANSVVELPAGGSQLPLTGLTNYSFPVGLTVDNYTNVYLASYGSGNIRVLPLGAPLPKLFTNAFSNLSEPEGVAVDASGDVFAADTAHNRIEELPINGSAGSLTYGAVTFFGTLVSNNYVISSASGDVTNTATPTFSALTASAAITYGASNVTLGGTLSGPGPTYPATNTLITVTINGNAQTTTLGASGVFTINDTNIAGLPVSGSPYVITYSSAAIGALLPSTNTSTTLTVNPLPVDLTGNRPYDGTNDATAGILTVTNIVGSDVVNVVSGSGVLAGSNVGAQAITSAGTLALGGAAAGNYTLAGASGTVTITSAALTITANSPSKTYGQSVTFAGTEFSPSGLLNNDTVTSVTLASPGAAANATVAGSPYSIVPSAAVGSGLGNYTITYVNGLLTVNPLPVILTGTRPYDGTATAAAAILSVANAVGGDDVNVASGSATLAGASLGPEAITSVGSLALGGTTAGNYTLAGGSGSVTITGATGSLVYQGLTNTSLGAATLGISGSQLVVANMGSNGQDGVSISLPGYLSGLDVGWQPLDVSNTLPVGAYTQSQALGTLNGVSNSVFGTITSTKAGTGDYVVSADYSPVGADTFTVQAYLQGSLVAQATGMNEASIVSTGSMNSTYDIETTYIPCDLPGCPPMTSNSVDWNSPVTNNSGLCVLPSGIVFDHLYIGAIMSDSSNTLGAPTTFQITASQIPSLTITSENAGILYGSLANTSLGNATIAASGGQLVVSDLGSNGLDGVAMAIPTNLSVVSYQVASWDPTGTLPIGAYVQGQIIGTTADATNQVLGTVTSTKIGTTNYQLSADFTMVGATTYSILASYQGVLVATASNLPMSTTILIGNCLGCGPPPAPSDAGSGYSYMFNGETIEVITKPYGMTVATDPTVNLPGVGVVTADTLNYVPDNVAALASPPTAYQIVASQVPLLDITGLSVEPLLLSLSQMNSNLVLQWYGTGVLQSTGNLSNTNWPIVSGAMSPYITPASGSNQFFRISQPAPQ